MELDDRTWIDQFSRELKSFLTLRDCKVYSSDHKSTAQVLLPFGKRSQKVEFVPLDISFPVCVPVRTMETAEREAARSAVMILEHIKNLSSYPVCIAFGVRKLEKKWWFIVKWGFI